MVIGATFTVLLLMLRVVMVGTVGASLSCRLAPKESSRVPDEEMIWWKDNIPEAYVMRFNNGQILDWDAAFMREGYLCQDSMCIERVAYEPVLSVCAENIYDYMGCHVYPDSRGAMHKVVDPCDGWICGGSTPPHYYWEIDSTRFDTDITFSDSSVPNFDQTMLKWSDSNGMGNNNYRVERDVWDGYEDTILCPKSDTAIQDTIKPEWLGQIMSYVVYEWLGEQKLFSDTYDITIPSKLEAPRNLVATTRYEECICTVTVLSWKDTPLFHNYIIEGLSDGTRNRIEETGYNTISLYMTAGKLQFRVMSQIPGVTSESVEITIQYSSEGGTWEC